LQTRVLTVDRDRPDPASLEEAAAVLSRGGLVAFATETVYGLGAVATDPEAVAQIYEAKGRPSYNPLIVHVAGIDQAKACVREWPGEADRLAGRFWPGPLTLVLPRSGLIPDIVTAGKDTVGLRVPVPAVARGLIERVGRPVAAPSANRANRVSPTCAEHVLANLEGRIDLVLDSGPTTVGLESTVLDLARPPFRILRPGPVGAHEIDRCLGNPGRVASGPHADSSDREPASPGMLPVHYAPRTSAVRFDSVDELVKQVWPGQTAVLVFGPDAPPESIQAVERIAFIDPLSAALGLYATLHRLDALGLDQLVVVMPPDRPEWSAVRDRLRRATKPATPWPGPMTREK
jgi:L-threonylcarbamoyladenylate synthase